MTGLTDKQRQELLRESKEWENEAKRLQDKADWLRNGTSATGLPHRRADLRTALSSAVQCTARSKSTGQRCKKYAMMGGCVCRQHGGAAPQAKAAAMRRLQQALEPLAMRLLGLALDEGVPENVALNAINSAMDRAGLGIKASVELELKPYQQVIEQVESGSRADWRRSQGIEDDTQPALPASEDVEDVEVVEDWLEPITPEDDDYGLDDDLGPLAPTRTPTHDVQMLSFEDAVSAQRALPPGHAKSITAQPI